MSEWYDNRKKPNSNFRKLLRERIEKANPRRKLTTEEAKRLTKLEALADKLKRGENVQNRQLQTWLSKDEYAQVDIEWQEQLELREELKDKPSEIKRYEDKLKEAIMMRNRSDAYHRKGRKSAAYKVYTKCDSFSEAAFAILPELVAAAAHMHISLHINSDFRHGT